MASTLVVNTLANTKKMIERGRHKSHKRNFLPSVIQNEHPRFLNKNLQPLEHMVWFINKPSYPENTFAAPSFNKRHTLFRQGFFG